MRIQLSESGHSKEWKPLKGINASFAKMEDSPFGKDYFLMSIERTETIADLLKNFDSNKELEFYFCDNILYITIESESFIYTVEMFDESLNDFVKQIKREKKIIIAILGDNKVEILLSNTIIM